MNTSWYFEDECSPTRESTLQQIKYTAQGGPVQINQNSFSGKQHYNKLQQL
jgi:hypothetical protein